MQIATIEDKFIFLKEILDIELSRLTFFVLFIVICNSNI